MDDELTVRYLTDDRDYEERNELVMSLGPNGDLYISVVPEGEMTTQGVRICTSGGAMSRHPRAVDLLLRAFWAFKEPRDRVAPNKKAYSCNNRPCPNFVYLEDDVAEAVEYRPHCADCGR